MEFKQECFIRSEAQLSPIGFYWPKSDLIRQLHKTSVAAQMLCLSQGHLHRLKDSH